MAIDFHAHPVPESFRKWLPILSMGWNLVLFIFYVVLALRGSFWWNFTLCMFYLGLGLMRAKVIIASKVSKRPETALMRNIGIGLCVFSIVISGITLLTIHEHINPSRGLVVMVSLAAFTFLMLGLSVKEMIVAHKKRSATLITLRNIGMAGTVGSILSLERGMLGTFGNAEDMFTISMEAVSGLVAFLFLNILGIGLILNARSYERAAKKDEEAVEEQAVENNSEVE